jgi:PTS hybrid protein
VSTNASPRRVGLVVVSHSARIAEGTVELAAAMAGPDVRLRAAGGAADGTLGTDAPRIAAAVEEADAGAGVVVLVDIGSAVLAAETALELLSTSIAADIATRTRISRGPLVEGAVIAAVQASIGEDVASVLRAAEDAARIEKR